MSLMLSVLLWWNDAGRMWSWLWGSAQWAQLVATHTRKHTHTHARTDTHTHIGSQGLVDPSCVSIIMRQHAFTGAWAHKHTHTSTFYRMSVYRLVKCYPRMGPCTCAPAHRYWLVAHNSSHDFFVQNHSIVAASWWAEQPVRNFWNLSKFGSSLKRSNLLHFTMWPLKTYFCSVHIFHLWANNLL